MNPFYVSVDTIILCCVCESISPQQAVGDRFQPSLPEFAAGEDDRRVQSHKSD